MRRGSHHTVEALAKMSAASTGNQNAANPTAETRASLSAARMGNQNALGYKHSPEARAKMSAAKMGKKASLETRARISVAHKDPSTETRAKMSAAMLGNTYRRGPNYRANSGYCAKVYEVAWGPIPLMDNGRAYDVHHRDGNRQNDDPENLIVLTVSEHMTLERAFERGAFDLAAETDAIGLSRRGKIARVS